MTKYVNVEPEIQTLHGLEVNVTQIIQSKLEELFAR